MNVILQEETQLLAAFESSPLERHEELLLIIRELKVILKETIGILNENEETLP